MLYHFNKYQKISNEAKDLSLRIIDIENKLYGLKAVNYTDVKINSGDKHYNYNLSTEREFLLQKYKDALSEKRKLFNQHWDEIEKIDNESYKSLLRQFYLLDMSIEQIAESNQRGKNWAYVNLKKAEAEFMNRLKKVQT